MPQHSPSLIRYVDPQTGQPYLILPEPLSPPTPPPLASWPLPVPVSPPILSAACETAVPTRPRASAAARRAERKGRLAGRACLWFVMSWVPCGFEAPGLTLLMWGVGVAYLLYRAVRTA